MHPVFLSMGKVHDTNLAAKVKDSLPDGLVYMYTRNGEEGTAFHREIEAEVNHCKLFVVFWSDDYLASEHAILELATFKRSAEALDSGRELLVVQTTRKTPNIQRRWKNPLNGKDEFMLGRWRLDRAVSPDRDSNDIAELIKRKLESAGVTSSVLVPRPDVQKAIGFALDGGDFYKREFVFISGSEGDGRRTAIKIYMEGSKHILPKFIAFDNSEGPHDVLERLLEHSGEPLRSQIEIITKVSAGLLDPIKEIRKIVHRFRDVRNYLVLIMDKYSGVDASGGIPKWVSKVIEPFKIGRAPLIFFVTSNPITDELLWHYPNAGRARIPGFEDREMRELVFNLSDVDPNVSRWTVENQNLVAEIAGSSPSLCQKIMKLAASAPNLQHIDRLARSEEEKFSVSLTGLVAYIVEKFKDSVPDILAMQVVEKLGIVDKSTLDEIMEIESNGDYDLYGLLQYGVFEQLSDNLLRIPPLLQRRLGFVLWEGRPELKLDKVLEDFGTRRFEIDDGHGIVYMANKAAASLRSGSEASMENQPFVTMSMLFKAGVERYVEEDYIASHSILRRAMDRLNQPSNYVDETISIEISRYFGLASVRIRNDADVDRARELLATRFRNSKKEKQAEAMAAFLNGFKFRFSGDNKEALVHFEQANVILSNIAHASRQHGAVLTEISRANLRLSPPRLDSAVRAAQQAFQRQDAIHNLNSLVKAKIYKLAYSIDYGSQLEEIEKLLLELKKISERSGREFHLVRSADLNLVSALKLHAEKKSPLDLTVSINLAEQSLAIRRTDGNQLYLWKLKTLHQVVDLCPSVIGEAQAVYNSVGVVSNYRKNNAAKALVMSYAKNDPKRATQLLNGFKDIGGWPREFLKSWIDGKITFAPGLVLGLNRL